jgi:hypothetical protein
MRPLQSCLLCVLQDRGAFHTDKLHATEKLRREGETLYFDVIADHPTLSAQPLVEHRELPLMKNFEIEGGVPQIANWPVTSQR